MHPPAVKRPPWVSKTSRPITVWVGFGCGRGGGEGLLAKLYAVNRSIIGPISHRRSAGCPQGPSKDSGCALGRGSKGGGLWGGVARLEDGFKSQRVRESDEKGWGDAGFDPIGVPAPLWHRSTPMIGSRPPPRSPGAPRDPPAPRRSAPDTDARLLAVPIHSFGGSPGLYGKKEREGGGLSSRRNFLPWEGGEGQWKFKTPLAESVPPLPIEAWQPRFNSGVFRLAAGRILSRSPSSALLNPPNNRPGCVMVR